MSFFEKLLLRLIFHVRSDYFTYLLGVISAFLTEGVLNVLQIKVSRENLLKFILMLLIFVFCVFLAIAMLKFSISFSDFQSALSLHKTERIKANAFFEKIKKDSEAFIRLKKTLIRSLVYLVILFLIMLSQFVLLNMNIL